MHINAHVCHNIQFNTNIFGLTKIGKYEYKYEYSYWYSQIQIKIFVLTSRAVKVFSSLFFSAAKPQVWMQRPRTID